MSCTNLNVYLQKSASIQRRTSRSKGWGPYHSQLDFWTYLPQPPRQAPPGKWPQPSPRPRSKSGTGCTQRQSNSAIFLGPVDPWGGRGVIADHTCLSHATFSDKCRNYFTNFKIILKVLIFYRNCSEISKRFNQICRKKANSNKKMHPLRNN